MVVFVARTECRPLRSNLSINTALPEDAARMLRDVDRL